MTTDQIKRTDGTKPDGDAGDETATALEAAETEAKQVLAKARYEAFRMVTDARAEAESILADAERAVPDQPPTNSGTVQDDGTVSAIIAAAEEKAAAIVLEAEQAAARLYESSRASVEQQTAKLRERHVALEAQVAATQTLLADLEERLALIASPSGSIPPRRAPTLSYSLAGETEPSAEAQVTREIDLNDPDNLPPAASADTNDPDSVVETASLAAPPPVSREQGSFYTRRSANLPSIGSSGGQDALSAVRSMRSKIDPQG